MSQNRILKYDIIKGIAAILICAYHLQWSQQGMDLGHFENGQYIPTFYKFILGLCAAGVPLFFTIIGAIETTKYRDIKSHIRKILKIAFLYTIWSFILGSIINFLTNNELPYNLLDATLQIFNTPGYLWFFQSMIILYLFNILFQKIKNNRYSILIFIGIIIFPFVSNLIFVVICSINPSFNLPSWGHTGFYRLYAVVYFLIPFYIKRKFNIITCIILILSGLFTVFFEVCVYSNKFYEIYDGVNACFPTIGALLMCLGIFKIFDLVTLPPKISQYITFLGTNCLGSYLFHFPLIILIHKFYRDNFGIIETILITLFITYISAYITVILRKLKIFNFLLRT